MSQSLINQIDTPDNGADAPNASGFGADGLAAPAVSETFAGDSLAASSAALNLTPYVRGGLGSAGVVGATGTTRLPTQTVLPPSSPGGLSTIENTYFGGGAGGPGGAGGAGASAALTMQSDIIGTAATPYTGSVTLDATAIGGPGGAGGSGAAGGSGGFSEVIAFPPAIDLGAAGGPGGGGGAGGKGGDATAVIDSVSIVASMQPAIIAIDASGGAGGVGGNGAVGGGGGAPSAGGDGGAGGASGTAAATLSNSVIVDPLAVTIDLAAASGAGSAGGAGVDGGEGQNLGSQGFGTSYTATYTAGTPGNGGDGGAAGGADITVTGNVVTTATASVTLATESVFTSNGGPGGPAVPSQQITETSENIVNLINTIGQPAGAHGAAGAIGPTQVTFTGNTITATVDLSLAFNADAPLNAAAGGNLVFSGNSLVGGLAATLDISKLGTNVTVDDASGLLSVAGSPGNGFSGFGTFILSSGATYIAGAGHPQVIVLPPDPDTIVLAPGHAAITLDGATPTNTILQFQGYGAALDSLAQLQADTITSGQNLTIDIAGDGAIVMAPTNWVATASTVTFAPACFVAGARIMTGRGEVPVERLGLGDLVLTVSGTYRPVRWLGRRVVVCHRHPDPKQVWPIRIATGAFGPLLPRRDLLLSPDHAVFVDGVLIPVRLLIDGAAIAQAPRGHVAYWHVELDQHDVVLADGLPCESFLDTGQRAAFANGGGAVQLQPDFAQRRWDADSCAPLVVAGPALDRVRAMLRATANSGGSSSSQAMRA